MIIGELLTWTVFFLFLYFCLSVCLSLSLFFLWMWSTHVVNKRNYNCGQKSTSVTKYYDVELDEK